MVNKLAEPEKLNKKFFKKINKKIIIRTVLIIMIIINCVIIFNFSSQKSEQSNQTSGKVVEKIIETSPKTKNLNKKQKEEAKEKIVTPVRKTAHFTAYMSLGIWIYLCSMTFRKKEDKNCNNLINKKRVLISIGLSFIYACSDEIHQLFVPGRSGEIRDICIDTCGAGFGVLLVWCFMKIIEKLKNKKNVSKKGHKLIKHRI